MILQPVFCYRLTDIQKAINNVPEEYQQDCIAFDQYYGKMIFKRPLPNEVVKDCGLMEDKPDDFYTDLERRRPKSGNG